jgi:uncharacterized protein (DUF2235 family)
MAGTSQLDNDLPSEQQVAPEGSQTPSTDDQAKQNLPKSIFIFADGTGNSSAKLFKTNVWRLYEALDLRRPGPDEMAQIAYYDNGVGTSNFRPLRLLGGIFGIGLKKNVLRLYAFLCRNYNPGDKIYCFGFSRGAFTIRLLVGLITGQGILRDQGDGILSYQIRDAYRAACDEFLPNRWPARMVAMGLRWVRDKYIHAKRTVLRQRHYHATQRVQTDVDFVGVWDTVAAYGGPFAEFTRGIDDWVWPLTMPHYGLSPKVIQARHALALDEERDAFQPLLWDEFRENFLITEGGEVVVGQDADGKPIKENRKVQPERLQQVWFTGVHSDVGGGYPDESLSYISLLWMMDELSPTVRFLPAIVERVTELVNPFGPLHDSRSGLGAYYRYMPRKLTALLHPPHIATKSIRDPEVNRGLPEHGLLKDVKVHESALIRTISGIDNYAPSNLPADFKIVSATGPFAKPVLTMAQHAELQAASANAALRLDHQENAWNLVWARRVAYFATVAASLLLLALPLYSKLDFIEKICGDDRCFAPDIANAILFFIPATVREWVALYAAKPLLVLLLGLLIAGLMSVGKFYERKYRDRVRVIWLQYRALGLPVPAAKSTLRHVRESAPYQWGLYLLKWRILPTIFGIATLVVIFYALGFVVTQTRYALVEPHSSFCKDREDNDIVPDGAKIRFSTKETCTDLKVKVAEHQLYRLDIGTTEAWTDDGHPANPATGVPEQKLSFLMRAYVPYRRVTSANYLQPVTEVRTYEFKHRLRALMAPLLGPDIDIRETEFVDQGSGRYSMAFCPRQTGQLYLFVNDVDPPFTDYFYSNNHGAAEVTITPLGQACDPDLLRECQEKAEKESEEKDRRCQLVSKVNEDRSLGSMRRVAGAPTKPVLRPGR